MDDWEKFSEKSLHNKKDFYIHLDMKDITDADYTLAKRFCKDFEIKHLGEYHDLYVQSDHYYLWMYLRTFEICILKYMNLIVLILFQLLD